MPNKQDSKNIFHALQGTFLTTCFSLYCAAECTGLFLLFTYRRLQSTSPQALLLFQQWPLLEFLCFWQLGGMPALSCAADDPSNDPDLETGCMPGAASCVACWSAPCTADTAGTCIEMDGIIEGFARLFYRYLEHKYVLLKSSTLTCLFTKRVPAT